MAIIIGSSHLIRGSLHAGNNTWIGVLLQQVGTNFRWRSAPIIGYENTFDATGLPSGLYDVAKPLKGEGQWDLGALLAYERPITKKVNMRLQLNVQNLPNWQDPRLVKADYDISGYKGTANAIVPVLWELRRPRNYVLTTTFDF